MSSTAQGLSANADQLKAAVGRFKLGAENRIRASTPAIKPGAKVRSGSKKAPSFRVGAAAPAPAPSTEPSITALAQHTHRAEEVHFEEF
jgi:hypothetical protein